MDMPAPLPVRHRFNDGPLLHDGPIGALRFSPDGSRLLVAAVHYAGVGQQHYRLTLWDREDWRALWSWPSGDGGEGVRDSAFAPDSSLIYALGPNAVWRLAVSSGVLVGAPFPLPGPARSCYGKDYLSLAVSPEGRLLAVAERVGQRLLLLDAESGEIIRTIPVGYGAQSVVAFADDGRTLLSMQSWAQEDILTAFDVETGEAVVRFQGVRQHPNPLSLGVSPDGQGFALLVHAGGALRFWRTDQAAPVHDLWIEKPVSDVSEDEFDPWGAHMPARHRVYLHNWALLKDGRRVVTVEIDDRDLGERTILMRVREISSRWSEKTMMVHRETGHPPFLHNNIVVPIAVAVQAPEDLIAVGTADGRVAVWDPNDGRTMTLRNSGQGGPVDGLVMLDNDTLISSAFQDPALRVTDLRTGETQEWARVPPDAGDVVRLVGGADLSRLVTLHKDGIARVWNVAERRVLYTVGLPGEIHDIDLSPDGLLLVTAGNYPIEPEERGTMNPERVFSDDGRLALWDASGRLVWDRMGYKLPGRHFGDCGWFRKVRFVPGKQWIAAMTDEYESCGPVRIWDPTTGEEAAFLERGDEDQSCFAISPNGRRAVCGAGCHWTFCLYDLDAPEARHFCRADHCFGGPFAISPDGTLAAVGGHDGRVTLWNFATGACVGQGRTEAGAVHALCFTPDGERLLGGAVNGVIVVWDVTPATAAAAVEKGAIFSHANTEPERPRTEEEEAYTYLEDPSSELWDPFDDR